MIAESVKKPRYLEIAGQLKEHITTLNSGDAFHSESEICRQFNVSRMTANRILNYLGDEGYIFREQGRGTFVKRNFQAERPVKYIFPDAGFTSSANGDVYCREGFGGALEAAKSANLEVEQLIVSVGRKYSKINLSAIKSLSTEDKVILPYYYLHRSDFLDAFSSRNCQTVFIHRQMQIDIALREYYQNWHTVMIDRCAAMRNVVSYLAGKRRKRIAFLNYTAHPDAPFYKGFIEGLAENNLPYIPELSLTGNYAIDFSYNSAMQLIMCRKFRPFDALITMYASQAIGAIQALHDSGIKVPEDVAVVSCTDEQHLESYIQPVTAVNLRYAEAGRIAMNIFNEDCYTPGATEIVTPELIERETS
ncbi:MAG: GntR family transcriptional regulator [Victivallaceae bacterium]